MSATLIIGCDDETPAGICPRRFFSGTTDLAAAERLAQEAGWRLRPQGRHSCNGVGGTFPNEPEAASVVTPFRRPR